MDRKTFRITKVGARTVKTKNCEHCGDKISQGHKIAIAGNIYCDNCVVSGFLTNKERAGYNIFRSIKSAFQKTGESVSVMRYVEKRNQKPIVKPESVEPIEQVESEPKDTDSAFAGDLSTAA